MPENSKKVIIIGCGIAGPVLALALHRAGIESEIYEARNSLDDDLGLFHYLSPSGMNVFNTLDIYDKIKDIGYDSNGVIHYDEKGNPFATMDEKDSKKIYGAGSIMIKRGLITKILRDEVISRGIGLHFDKKLKDIQEVGKARLTACFEGGTSAQGDLLVGCDGIHSRTRKVTMPDAPEPRYTKVIVSGGYAGISIKNKTSNVIHSNYCRQAFFAYFVLPDGKIWWWNGMSYPQKQTREELEKIPNEQWQQRLIDLYKEDSTIIQDIVGATHEKFLKFPIYEMPPIENWHKGNVCLIGDAVHALSPHAGQGATLAMEDAVMLAKCLRDIEDTKDAFVKFQQLRKQRTEKISKIARTTGEGYFETSPIKKRLRNTALKLMLTPFIFNRMAKFFFGYNIDWNEKIKS